MNILPKFMVTFLLLPCFIFGAAYQASSTQTPTPRPTMGQITPAHGPLPNHSADVVIDAEFLWWFANVGNLPYATVKIVLATGNESSPQSVVLRPDRQKEFGVEWDPGVRVGLGVITNHDGWDVYADWTYFYNSKSKTTSVPLFREFSGSGSDTSPGTHILSSPWFNNVAEDHFDRIKGKWSILFHQFDLVLGRKYWISPNLVLRPYGGLRGHWSRLHLRVEGTYDGEENISTFFDEFDGRTANWKQKFWAVGLLAGIDTAWHMTKNWSVIGDAALALVYGRYDVRNRYSHRVVSDNNGVIETTTDYAHTYNNDSIYSIQPVIDLALGFRWETTFSNESYRITFDTAWENHTWIDFNKFGRPTSEDASDQSFISAEGNLSMSGLVFRARFEF